MAQNNVIKEISVKKGNINLLEKQLGAEAQNIDVSYDASGNIIEDITEPGVVINETKSLTSALLDMQDNISDKAVTWEEMDILGSKNFLITTPDNITDNGITFIVDSNGIITMNGRASEEAIYEITLPQPINYGCKFTINCLNLAQGVSVFVLDNNDTVIGDGYFGENGKTGNDEILINSNQNIFKIRIKVRANILVYNVILRPMLRLSCIKDKNFASYAMTNKELTNEVIENKVLLKDTVGWVRKNLIPVTLDNLKINGNTNGTWNGNICTLYGVTFTIDTDENGNIKKIIANGTSSQSFSLLLYKDYELSKGKYLLNGCPSGGGINSYRIRIGSNEAGSIWAYNENNSDTPFNLDTDMKIAGVIDIGYRYTLNNVVFYPMLRRADISDSTYEPYHKSVDVVKANREELKDTIGWTGKNLLQNPATSQTVNGITFTVNADKSVKVNGTASARSTLVFVASTDNVRLPVGSYILSRGVAQAGVSLVLDAYNGSSWVKTIATSNNTDEVVTDIDYIGYDRVAYYIVVENGVTVSNVTVYPMIRKASIADSTYEPYHPAVKQTLRNAEVIEGKNLLQIPKTVNTATFSGVTFTITRNSDGEVIEIDANGTASANATLYIGDLLPKYGTGKFIASGLPSDGSGQSFNIRLGTKTSATDQTGTYLGNVMLASGYEFTLNAVPTYGIAAVLQIISGYTANHVKFKPMFRYATETDSTFEPYYIPLKDSKFDRSEQAVLGAKNLLKNKATSQTTNGVTFTVNADGSITANGTATASAFYSVTVPGAFSELVNKGKVLFTGCPTGGSWNTYQIDLRDASTNVVKYKGIEVVDHGNGIILDFSDITTSSGTVADVYANIRIQSGTICNNLKFYPMLRLASDPDDTYAPYAMTNRELTSEVTSSKDLLKDTVGWTGKNLLPNSAQTQTVNGVTFTVNSDGTISLNGTASDNTFVSISDWFDLPAGDYILNGSATDKIYVYIQKQTSGGTETIAQCLVAYPNGVSFNWDGSAQVRVRLVVENGQNTNGKTIYPMLRRADIADSTYEPYHATVEQWYWENNAKTGVHQLLDIPASQTINGITYTADANKYVSASVSEDERYWNYNNANIRTRLKAGTYKIKLYIKTLSTSGSKGLVVMNPSSEFLLGVGDPAFNDLAQTAQTFTLTEDTDIGLEYKLGNGAYSFSIWDASDTVETLLPYAMTNRELTDNKMSYVDNGVLGAKNLLKYPYGQTTKTENGITFTDNGTGTITANGTATAQAKFYPQRREDFFAPPKGRYVASAEGLISGTSIIIEGYTSSAWVKNITNLTPSSPSAEIDIDYNGYDRVVIYISIANGTTVSNIVFKPMIRLASDPDDTYAPYAMTNKQLTESKDSWTGTATVNSSNQVTFTGLNDNYGYSNPCFENKLVNVTTMTKSGSGSNVTLVFTLSGASQGDVCKLRIFK